MALNKTHKIVNVGLDCINVLPRNAFAYSAPRMSTNSLGSIKANGLLAAHRAAPEGDWQVTGL